MAAQDPETPRPASAGLADRWGHDTEDAGAEHARLRFQTARCQRQPSICCGGSSSPLVFHCLHGTRPNTFADHTEGGWLGEKARDLRSQTVWKSTVPPLWQIPGSQNSEATVWGLERSQEHPGCHSEGHTSYCRACGNFSCPRPVLQPSLPCPLLPSPYNP